MKSLPLLVRFSKESSQNLRPVGDIEMQQELFMTFFFFSTNIYPSMWLTVLQDLLRRDLQGIYPHLTPGGC